MVAAFSRAQRLGRVNFDDPNYLNSEYVPMKAYAQSKSANILFAIELDRLGKAYDVRASFLSKTMPAGIPAGIAVHSINIGYSLEGKKLLTTSPALVQKCILTLLPIIIFRISLKRITKTLDLESA